MLSGLLSKEECAGCRLCCSFESYDLFDTPTFTPESRRLILREYAPGQQFIESEGCFIMKMTPLPDSDIYPCPVLDPERGCKMGERKPFECRIWPLRVMRLNGRNVITLSPACPVMQSKPRELIREKCLELAPVIFAEARSCPRLVRPYIKGYEVFASE